MMQRNLHLILLLSLAIILLSVTISEVETKTEHKFTCVTPQKIFVAGTTVQLAFKGNAANKPQLFIIHSSGRTLIDGNIKKGEIIFNLPSHYSKKTGFISWFLLENNTQTAAGNFEIIPNDATQTKLESYLGPPSTLAGNAHFVMFVTIPTDKFDNPKPQKTAVAIRHQFRTSTRTNIGFTKDFIAWEHILSPQKSGLIIISATSNEAVTKEFDAVIYPNIATDFSIFYKRNHEFADGNQMTTLTTSILRDQYKNTVSDGTMVNFIIKNKKNVVLKTFGTTIDGVATGQILHPEQEDKYSVKAYVNGISKSNLIQIIYKAIDPEIDYIFSKDKKLITVGPIKSFINQLIPDGIKINLKIYKNNELVETLIENSFKGTATFELIPLYQKESEYQFEIETLGKSIKVNNGNRQ